MNANEPLPVTASVTPSPANGSSPATDSPETPQSDHLPVDVNVVLADDDDDDDDRAPALDIRESDARHEPAKLDHSMATDASTRPEVSLPPDPASIPISPPKGSPPPPLGQLLEDVKMAEGITFDYPNGVPADHDSSMANLVDGDVASPSLPSSATLDATAESPSYDVSINISSSQNDLAGDDNTDDAKPPPSKRARKFSDADMASIANSATPPPVQSNGASTSTPSTPAPASLSNLGPSTISGLQHRFLLHTIRTLKKMKDAHPFLAPVDPIALNIPHYPSIIKNPMDLGTIERKVLSSNPQKIDTNPNNPRYYNADEFIADVRIVFTNCETFNGPDHAVTQLGKNVEAVFDKQIKNLPPPAEVKPPIVKKPSPPPAPIVAAKKTAQARRQSTSIPVIRRSDTMESVGRPKREIHPPPPKDLPYADAPKKPRKRKAVRDDMNAEQLKYCAKLLSELHRKQHWAIANPFYEPVDWVKLEIPTYPKIVKKPMDLSTMRKKLENQEYQNAEKFYNDFKQMIWNCFQFNPAGTPVNQAGIELQRLFDEKWRGLPQALSEDEEEDEEDSEDERARAIAMMENQIETMRGNLAALKGKPAVKEKKKDKREKVAVPGSSKAKPAKAVAGNGAGKRGRAKKPAQLPEDDILTFEQKKDLSEAIQRLDGTKLEKVIQIIHEGVPEIRDSTEEIELEIDLLPIPVLTKLYNFVIRPTRQPPVKRNRGGKGTGTGGLKRKSMDEQVEAEKIRQLEERMRLFEDVAGGGLPAISTAGIGNEDSEHSSDSSSGSDSSGSDSE